MSVSSKEWDKGKIYVISRWKDVITSSLRLSQDGYTAEELYRQLSSRMERDAYDERIGAETMRKDLQRSLGELDGNVLESKSIELEDGTVRKYYRHKQQ